MCQNIGTSHKKMSCPYPVLISYLGHWLYFVTVFIVKVFYPIEDKNWSFDFLSHLVQAVTDSNGQ